MRKPIAFLAALTVALTGTLIPTTAAAAPARKVIYLTSDDGPGPNTRAVLNGLTKHGARMTFFFTGEHMQQHPGYAQLVRRQGSVVANHSWSHPHLPALTAGQVRSQLARTQAILGKSAGNCYRPPFLDSNAGVRQVATGLGLREVLAHINTKDWQGRPARAIRDTVVSQARPGAIVLMHMDTADRRASYDALMMILPALKAKGYTFEALPYCRER